MSTGYTTQRNALKPVPFEEEAIANAHYKRDLKNAAGEGNVETVKQLT